VRIQLIGFAACSHIIIARAIINAGQRPYPGRLRDRMTGWWIDSRTSTSPVSPARKQQAPDQQPPCRSSKLRSAPSGSSATHDRICESSGCANLGAHVLKSNVYGPFRHFSCITVHRHNYRMASLTSGRQKRQEVDLPVGVRADRRRLCIEHACPTLVSSAIIPVKCLRSCQNTIRQYVSAQQKPDNGQLAYHRNTGENKRKITFTDNCTKCWN